MSNSSGSRVEGTWTFQASRRLVAIEAQQEFKINLLQALEWLKMLWHRESVWTTGGWTLSLWKNCFLPAERNRAHVSLKFAFAFALFSNLFSRVQPAWTTAHQKLIPHGFPFQLVEFALYCCWDIFFTTGQILSLTCSSPNRSSCSHRLSY